MACLECPFVWVCAWCLNEIRCVRVTRNVIKRNTKMHKGSCGQHECVLSYCLSVHSPYCCYICNVWRNPSVFFSEGQITFYGHSSAFVPYLYSASVHLSAHFPIIHKIDFKAFLIDFVFSWCLAQIFTICSFEAKKRITKIGKEYQIINWAASQWIDKPLYSFFHG